MTIASTPGRRGKLNNALQTTRMKHHLCNSNSTASSYSTEVINHLEPKGNSVSEQRLPQDICRGYKKKNKAYLCTELLQI